MHNKHRASHFVQRTYLENHFFVVSMLNLTILEYFSSVCEQFFSLIEVLVDKQLVVGVAIKNFATGAANFDYFVIIFSDSVSCLCDLRPYDVQLLQVRFLFLELSPEVFVKFGGEKHGFFKQGYMIIKTDSFYQV